MDLIHEDQIGAGAVEALFRKLLNQPTRISLKNLDLRFGDTHVTGGVDITISLEAQGK